MRIKAVGEQMLYEVDNPMQQIGGQGGKYADEKASTCVVCLSVRLRCLQAITLSNTLSVDGDIDVASSVIF